MHKIRYSARNHATSPGSLTSKLDWLRGYSQKTPPDQRLIEWGKSHLRLDGYQLQTWSRRAWWGIAAGELIRFYLYGRALRSEALSLLIEPDFLKVEKALEKGGVLLAGAHLGPPKFLMNVILERFEQPLILTNTRDMPNWLPKLYNRLLDPIPERTRPMVMMKTALHLRQRGVVFGAPDGGFSAGAFEINEFNLRWRLSTGLAAISRNFQTTAFTALALWEDNEIKLHLLPIDVTSCGLTAQEQDHAWIEAHWDHIAEVIRNSPENLRFLFGMFRREMNK